MGLEEDRSKSSASHNGSESESAAPNPNKDETTGETLDIAGTQFPSVVELNVGGQVTSIKNQNGTFSTFSTIYFPFHFKNYFQNCCQNVQLKFSQMNKLNSHLCNIPYKVIPHI